MSRFHVGQAVIRVAATFTPQDFCPIGTTAIVTGGPSAVAPYNAIAMGDDMEVRLTSGPLLGKRIDARQQDWIKAEDSMPDWSEIATGRVKDSAVSQELGWKGKVSA